MKLVTCVKCGIVFDLDVAPHCEGHGRLDPEGRITSIRRSDFCFVCPLGHAGHTSSQWLTARRRDATSEEAAKGIRFMLVDYEVNPGGRP